MVVMHFTRATGRALVAAAMVVGPAAGPMPSARATAAAPVVARLNLTASLLTASMTGPVTTVVVAGLARPWPPWSSPASRRRPPRSARISARFAPRRPEPMRSSCRRSAEDAFGSA